MEFLDTLLKVSEKAANVARAIRREEHLFKLLVQQKDVTEANPRFVDDFKTLADVLIQEMVRHDLEIQFPGIKDRIRGEESNVFCNKLGEQITVEIKEEVEQTAELLEIVLNGDDEASFLLAKELHRSISLDQINTTRCQTEFELDVDDLGIWIDPIDSTAEYINAVEEEQDGISISGLKCVTILIGGYSLKTGEAVIGVVNQPFSTVVSDGNWNGQCFWGICSPSCRISSQASTTSRSNFTCLSSSEDDGVKTKLKEMGYSLIEAAGAGYKILNVIIGKTDCYVLSKKSTFKWDTCGPQAVLKSLGGDIVNYQAALKKEVISVSYPSDNKNGDHSNEGGLIAFKDINVLNEFMEHFT